MDRNKGKHFIYDKDGNIINHRDESAIGASYEKTKSSTPTIDLPEEIKETYGLHSDSMNSSYSNVNKINKTDIIDANKIYEKEYVYTLKQLEETVDKQVQEKLKGFLDESKLHKDKTKSNLDQFEKLLQTIMGFKQNNKSNAIAIGGVVAGIVLALTGPIFTNIFQNVNQISVDKEVMKKDIQSIELHIDKINQNKADKKDIDQLIKDVDILKRK